MPTSTSSSSSSSFYSTSSSTSLSSSSSSWLYSSSSSSSSRSSQSSSSSSSSSSTDASTSSTSSSSSSSVDSSSSSSSSYLDNHSNKTFPFMLNIDTQKSINSMAFYGDILFAGTSRNGMVITDNGKRFFWEDFYRVDDAQASAVFIDGNYLYIGTKPYGKVYRINLVNLAVTSYGMFNGAVVNFVKMGSTIFFVTSQRSGVYKYNVANDQWDLFYEPYSATVYQAKVLNNVIYLGVDGPYVLRYDGSLWSTVANTQGIRNVSKSPFNYTYGSFLQRSANTKTTDLDDEQVYDLFPQDNTDGISAITADGNSLVLGSAKYGRIYGVENGNLSLLWDTNSVVIRDLVNVDSGASLAAIGSKVFLIYSGSLDTTPEDQSSQSSQSEGDDPNEGKSIVVTAPNGGERYALGQDVLIQWSSTKGVNDAVKIELYQDGSFYQTINSKTLNTGSYAWTIPLSLEIGSNYTVYIEWLSAGNTLETDKDESDASFSILAEIESSSSEEIVQTETTTASALSPCRGIPIIELQNDEYVTSFTKDPDLGILMTTSNGRILAFDTASVNAYRTGVRNIYGNVRDGFGNISTTAQKQFMYALVNRVIEITEDKAENAQKFVYNASAIPCDRIYGVFVSPVLDVNEDVGFWKQLSWTETKPAGTTVTVYIKTAETQSGLLAAEWLHGFSYNGYGTHTVTKALNNVNLPGRYMQIKVEMETETALTTPSIANVSVTYSTKQAYYFYTIKFSLEKDDGGTDLRNGLLVANTTEPTNTEVKFGICDTDSDNWNDYTIVNPDQLFDIANFKHIKVGIKLVSYGTGIPSVSEFALIMGDDKKQVITS